MNGSAIRRAALASSILLATSVVIVPTPTQAAGQTAPTAQPIPNLDQILQHFDDSVYFKLPGGGTRFLAKWQDDVRVGIASGPEIPVDIARRLFDQLNVVATLSQHHVLVTNQNINFFVLFSTNLDADLKKYGFAFRRYFSSDAAAQAFYAPLKAGKAACIVKVSLNENYAIQGVAAIVTTPPSDLKAVEHCSYNIAFIGMGLLGRLEKVGATLSTSEESATIDADVLAILYHNELKSGSTADVDRPIISKIYAKAVHQ